MSPDGSLKIVSELLDLPLLDVEGKFCGIVDNVELAGSPGKELRLKALLVGPGAYRGRMPRWAMALVKIAVGDQIVRVPFDKVRSIDSMVHLDCSAGDLGLDKNERAAGKWLPRMGAF